MTTQDVSERYRGRAVDRSQSGAKGGSIGMVVLVAVVLVAASISSWKISGKGLVDFTDTVGASSLFTSMTARTQVTVICGVAGSGNKYYYGTGVIKDLKVAGPVEESVTYDFEIEGAGVLTEAQHT